MPVLGGSHTYDIPLVTLSNSCSEAGITAESSAYGVSGRKGLVAQKTYHSGAGWGLITRQFTIDTGHCFSSVFLKSQKDFFVMSRQEAHGP